MVNTWEVQFKELCPSIQQAVDELNQSSSVRAKYLTDKWLLINLDDERDILNLYQDRTHTIVLTKEIAVSNLLPAILSVLTKMGGICTGPNQ
ncbi:MAG: hypothetical protein EOO89_16810 [Pedobacter sp.]|nr:MAG: hypothetical protein EOO89_16810 [Pedobacter sp.]